MIVVNMESTLTARGTGTTNRATSALRFEHRVVLLKRQVMCALQPLPATVQPSAVPISPTPLFAVLKCARLAVGHRLAASAEPLVELANWLHLPAARAFPIKQHFELLRCGPIGSELPPTFPALWMAFAVRPLMELRERLLDAAFTAFLHTVIIAGVTVKSLLTSLLLFVLHNNPQTGRMRPGHSNPWKPWPFDRGVRIALRLVAEKDRPGD